MTMFHDTFCIPSTYDKLLHDEYTHQSMGPNNLQLDTQLGPIYAQPRSTNSSLSTTSAATTSSNDDLTKIDDHKLLLWIQHQLEHYITLSLLPPISSIDDIDHGKLLLCLIHRFAPESLPTLVTLLEDKTSIECLFLADELAQRLWNTVIDSLACYLYYQHIMISSNNLGSNTIGNFVDHLTVPPPPYPFNTSTNNAPTDTIVRSIPEANHHHHHQKLILPSDNAEGKHYAQRPAVINMINDPNWITTTHQLIQTYLQLPHTYRLLDLLTLLDQLLHLHVEFTRLTNDDYDDSPDTIHGEEFILPVHQLLGRLQLIGERLTIVTTRTTAAPSSSDNDDLIYLIDLLTQRHAWIQSALSLHQHIYRVYCWTSEQQQTVKRRISMDDQVALWTHYQQTNADVLVVEASTGLPAITTLDRLDTMLSTQQQLICQQQQQQQYMIMWGSTYSTIYSVLLDLHGSAKSLVHRSRCQVSPAIQQQQQQWKILSRRMDVFWNDRQGGYMAVMRLYDQLQSLCISSTSVDSDWITFTQQWQQSKACLETARRTIHQQSRIQDILQQYTRTQNKAMALEKQMDVVDLLGQNWIETCVQDLDEEIARIQVTSFLDDQDMKHLLQDGCDTLERCKLSYHIALDKYLAKCARIKQKQALDHLMYQVTIHTEALESALFDPWRCSLDEKPRLEQDLSLRKRRSVQITTNLNPWLIKQGPISQDITFKVDCMQQLLAEYESRLDILGKRLIWDHTWRKAYLVVKKTFDSVYGLIYGDPKDPDNLPQRGYKHDFNLAQIAFDQLVKTVTIPNRTRQRHYLLENQVIELDALLDTARSVITQRQMVHAYMNWVDELYQSSQSIGARLETELLADRSIDNVEQDLGQLQSLAIYLWHTSGSQIIYPLSSLVVNDLVRWKVIVAFDDLLASLINRLEGLHAWRARRAWENQWHQDMERLQKWQKHLRDWLQINSVACDNIIRAVGDYGRDPLDYLSNLFACMRQLYPIKIPLILGDRQQQLEVEVYGQVKNLCDLVNYLQTSKKLEAECNHMDRIIDEQGVDASEDLVQQWMHDVKAYIQHQLLDSLHDQQLQLHSIDEIGSNGQVWNKETIRVNGVKAQDRVDSLQRRLLDTLKSSQHTRLIQAYHSSASTLETTVQHIQHGLMTTTDTHGKMMIGVSTLDQEQTLRLEWQESTQILKTAGYNDVRSLCQLIQLEQQEPEVMARQTLLDSRWESIWQGLDQFHSLAWALSRWRGIMTQLDQVETTLASVRDYIDIPTMTLKTDLSVTLDVCLKKCQGAQTALATVKTQCHPVQGIPCEDHNHTVVSNRLDSLENLVDDVLGLLLQCIKNEADRQVDSIYERMASISRLLQEDTTWATHCTRLKQEMDESASKQIMLNTTLDLLHCDGKYVDLLEPCHQSMHHLSKAVETERYCSATLLPKEVACEHQATRLLSMMESYLKELEHFADQTHGEDWRLDLGVWHYRLDALERAELEDFYGNVQEWLFLDDPPLGDMVNVLGHQVQQEIRLWVQKMDTMWHRVKTQLADTNSQVTQSRLENLAIQQWQALMNSVEGACDRVVTLMSSNKEQNISDYSLSLLEHEWRPLLKSKVSDLKTTLTGLDSTWISSRDADEALEKWETMIGDYRHYLRYETALDQYQQASNQVNGHLYAMEQNMMVVDSHELETRHKIYGGALDVSLEKARQVAILVETLGGQVDTTLWVTRRNRLEQRFNHRMTHKQQSRSRKISLPSQLSTAAWVASSRHRRSTFTSPPNAYIADPQNDLDMEIGRIVNRAPYKVELEMMPGEAGRYRFGDKIVYCRILKSRVVMVRVGGGWTELSQFLREHALLVGTVTRKPSLDSCQEAFLETKRATCPTSGRPLLRSSSMLSITGNAGYKDGDRYIAVGWHGYQHEMKMTPHDNNNRHSNRL